MTGNEARAEYMRNWRKANRDKDRETQRRYWENKARKHNETAGPLDSLAAAIDNEIEKRKAMLAGATPEATARIEGEVRKLEDIRKRLAIPTIETRNGGTHDAEE